MVALSHTSGDAIFAGYSSSHALLIEQSDYPPGPWDDLESIPREQDRLETLLREVGMNTITRVRNAGLVGLRMAFEQFMAEHGFEKDARLFIFYSGHGYTTPDGKAYLVPSTSADPRKDLAQFKRETLDMNQVASWARQMDAKHVLLVFDSCFSGSIFAQRGPRDLPPWITQLTQEPVRYFITAGSANEQVPSQSLLVPNMIRGLRYGLADLNKDGFVTSGELGVYLREHIITTGLQTPQHGPLREPQFDGGDVVFRVPDPAWLATVDAESSAAESTLTVVPVTTPSVASPPVQNRAQDAIIYTPNVAVTSGAIGLDSARIAPDGAGAEVATQRDDTAVVSSTILSTAGLAATSQTGSVVASGVSEVATPPTNAVTETKVQLPSPLKLAIPKDIVQSAPVAGHAVTEGPQTEAVSSAISVPPIATSEPANATDSPATSSAIRFDTRGTGDMVSEPGAQPGEVPAPNHAPLKSYTKWILGALAVGAVAALASGGDGGGSGGPGPPSGPPPTTGTVNVVISVPTN